MNPKITITGLNPVCSIHGTAYHNGRCEECEKLETEDNLRGTAAERDVAKQKALCKKALKTIEKFSVIAQMHDNFITDAEVTLVDNFVNSYRKTLKEYRLW